MYFFPLIFAKHIDHVCPLEKVQRGTFNDFPQYMLSGDNKKINDYPCIRKTCPCNVYPLEPHFYVAKLGYAGIYLFFLFLLQNRDCGYSLEPPW